MAPFGNFGSHPVRLAVILCSSWQDSIVQDQRPRVGVKKLNHLCRIHISRLKLPPFEAKPKILLCDKAPSHLQITFVRLSIMKSLILLCFFTRVVFSKLLINFSAAVGDDPSVMGTRNLEAARGVTHSANTNDLYIELGQDPSGVPCAHYHRIAGDIRAEYHSLNGETKADTTYYIGYVFSLGEIEQSLMIWQL